MPEYDDPINDLYDCIRRFIQAGHNVIADEPMMLLSGSIAQNAPDSDGHDMVIGYKGETFRLRLERT